MDIDARRKLFLQGCVVMLVGTVVITATIVVYFTVERAGVGIMYFAPIAVILSLLCIQAGVKNFKIYYRTQGDQPPSYRETVRSTWCPWWRNVREEEVSPPRRDSGYSWDVYTLPDYAATVKNYGFDDSEKSTTSEQLPDYHTSVSNMVINDRGIVVTTKS